MFRYKWFLYKWFLSGISNVDTSNDLPERSRKREIKTLLLYIMLAPVALLHRIRPRFKGWRKP